MGLARTGCSVGAAMTVTLMMAAAPAARADAARDKQWPLQAFKASQRIWPVTTGKGQVIAIIDCGFRLTHVDLVGQFLRGKDFAPGAYDRARGAGHGTMMTSLIAGHGHGPDAAEGIMGLAPGAQVLPLTFDTNAPDSDQEVSAAIRYAVTHGAGVINMSFCEVTPSESELSAVAYAEARNVVLVAGAGNDGIEASNYPASYPGVVDVGGANEDGSVWGGSDFGGHLTLVGPASGVLGDGGGGDTQYVVGDGTSGASAYVAAAAALVRAAFPGLTAGQVVNRLIKSAVDPDARPGQGTPDLHYGYGVVRPDAALTQDIPPGPAAGPLPQATDPSAARPAVAATTVTATATATWPLWLAGATALLSLLGLLLRHRRRA